jgi:hypothetical protein
VSRQVEVAWQKLYVTQQPKFEWPVGLREYKEICDKWEIENPGKPFREDVRRAYLNTMTQDLEKERLKNKIQLLTIAAPMAGDQPRGLIGEGPPGVPGGPEQPAAVVKGLVKWGATTPGATEIDLLFQFPWIERSILVTDLEMRYAQEDLWVYEFLLDAISTVNEGCDETKPEKALLKEIIYLKIGQAASADPPTSNIMTELSALSGVPLPGAAGAAGGFGGFGGGPPVDGRAAAMGEGPPGAATARGDGSLKDRRYCDVDGKPISGAELDAKLATSQYKLMPVVMRLAMNQKELPKLLAALSNAVTPMRITQVQLYEGGGGSRVNVAAAGDGRGAPIDISNDPRFSLDVTVDIRGMVHIFLPPNTAQFPHRLEEAARAAQNGGAVPGAPPAGLPQPGVGGVNVNDGQPGLPDPSAIVPSQPPPVDPAAGLPAAGGAPAGGAPAPNGTAPKGEAAPPADPGAGAPPAAK